MLEVAGTRIISIKNSVCNVKPKDLFAVSVRSFQLSACSLCISSFHSLLIYIKFGECTIQGRFVMEILQLFSTIGSTRESSRA